MIFSSLIIPDAWLSAFCWLALFFFPVVEAIREYYVYDKREVEDPINEIRRRYANLFLYAISTGLICSVLDQVLYRTIILSIAISFFRWLLVTTALRFRDSDSNLCSVASVYGDPLDNWLYRSVAGRYRMLFLSGGFTLFFGVYFLLV